MASCCSVMHVLFYHIGFRTGPVYAYYQMTIKGLPGGWSGGFGGVTKGGVSLANEVWAGMDLSLIQKFPSTWCLINACSNNEEFVCMHCHRETIINWFY